jgi:hypothetical protein
MDFAFGRMGDDVMNRRLLDSREDFIFPNGVEEAPQALVLARGTSRAWVRTF